MTDLVTLGQRIRHYRTDAGLTLDQLGVRVGIAGSQLSLMENGRREPRLSLLQSIAGTLEIEVSDLLDPAPPTARAALEIELERMQRSPVYAALGLPSIRATRTMPDDTLDALVGLHHELARRSKEAIATPEEARRANTELRQFMRTQDNYIPEIEKLAQEQLRQVGHATGALTHRTVSLMAKKLGFELIFVADLPHSTRSVTDLENGRIYLPPASIPGGHGLRSMALQALAHRLLGHHEPGSYAEFLRQRLEINYFAAACLMPLKQSVDFLSTAKAERNLAIEDFRDAFGVTHEAAALRFTNLATSQLDMTVHFLRVGEDGALYKGYENDGLRFPTDITGSTEGQIVCRHWSARLAFERTNRTTEFYQYTDTPAGTFWCSTQIGTSQAEEFSITFGVPFNDAKWFRGRDTTNRRASTCPDASCCRRPSGDLASRWSRKAWASAKLHAHILSPLPSGTFPGVDDTELYDFLEAHSGS
ncbi:putative transcriptional regulator/DNA-binding XRE family transcriptional regulator [Cryobacterium mesophilum]|uniref:XRE family transcriptional regulator n=2 Tax=Terrimesophilobacter mesophilus TaxID=433647 RepID=A0A4R8VAA4_9MICO|nr:helix-turn-helix transcriptional regulator [Terrimesophilobacter mesophilus]MBB5632445.1 putative transcriptional regulator/DNA-binding XRE family transcriptional regulator [Terrimesophilobacter mesophilus]TFB79276.1 XRE family transcriptional regulator [Terrimesophilobacter mesophilus]